MDQFNFRMPGIGPPSMNNPPPQFFGGFGADNMQHLPPDIASQMFDSHMFFEDPHDAKRRRIARACDTCRKKKIKCDGKMPSCTQCLNYKTDCVFTPAEKKRQPPKGAKYIEGLENRLLRMEQVLRLSGLLDEDGETDLGALEKRLAEKHAQSRQESSSVASAPTSPSQTASAKDGSTATPYSTTDSPDLSKDKETAKEKDSSRRLSAVTVEEEEEEQLESLSEMMCSLVTNQSGETRYIGSSSGFSIFSPKGIQWVNQKTGDNSFQHMISEVSVDDHKWTNWKPEVFQDVFRRPVFRPLPPKEVALSLLKDYFENFNCMCPLFHQPTFMHLVERQYSDDPYEGSGWWASLNCALAISHRLRVMSNLVPQDEDDKAWGHIKNAMGVFAELTLRNTDLLSVQALIGIALFMQGTPNPQPSFVLVAAAIRLSHNIGLHKRVTGFNLNPIEVEQRKRVFWIAYMLDKDLCLRSGRPPAQDDDDMTVELPDADPADNIGNIPLADGKSKMNLFRTMCEFSVIESKVYNRLYSTKASKQSNGELLNAIGELDLELEEWKDSIPVEFRPEHEIKANHTPLILHVVMLHFAYYNCLTTIHRMSVNHGFWTSRLFNYAVQGLNSKALNPRVYSSSALCTAAARASIALLKYIPQGDNNCVWMILYFPVSALMTLFANIINNPLDSKAKSDARLMGMVVQFLSMLGQEAESGGVNRMLGVCAEFERIAGIVIEKAEKEPRRKRKNPDTPGKAASMANLYPGGPAAAAAAAATAAAAGTAQKPTPISSSSSQTPRPSTAASTATATPSMNPSAFQNNGNILSPHQRHDQHTPYTPLNNSMHSTPSTGWQPDYSMPQNGDFDSFVGMNGFTAQESPPIGMGVPFQQPLLPQDLFALPMNLDWNWAELSGGAYPTVENGRFGDDGQMHQ